MLYRITDFQACSAMAEVGEGGAGLAWRLLATLEGGSLFLATAALVAYTAAFGITGNKPRIPLSSVLITNTKSKLGKLLKERLESCGCVVSTITSDVTSRADSGPKVDALVVVGAGHKGQGLDGLSDFVSEDVYSNLKLLEVLSSRVKRGGCITWACSDRAETEAGPFRGAAAAFDTVIQTTLQHVAKVCHSESIWIGRCATPERTADNIVAALMTYTTQSNETRSAVRNAAMKVGEFLYKCLKTSP